MKVNAKINLKQKVERVAIHTSFAVCLASDSSDTWMPSASEKASAIAIVNIPPITASLEWVPECKPTINPNVVIIPEVNPKLIPTLKECSILSYSVNLKIKILRMKSLIELLKSLKVFWRN